MSAKKGLGRGFASLIPTDLLDESFDPTSDQDEQVSELRHIKISEIHADPEQPRKRFDEAALAELAASIKEHGILQPIVVTVEKTGGYSIVAGERRYRAAKLAGLEKVPAIVRTLGGQHKLELSLIENLQRKDLNVMETATAYAKLRDQFNLTLDEIGKRVGGKSVPAISNTLRLLKLPKSVQVALVEDKIKEGQARPLIGLDEETIEKVLPLIIRQSWSARRIEQYIVDLKNSSSTQQGSASASSGTSHDKEVSVLSRRFSTDVSIRSSAKGSGRIVIKFKNQREFDRITKLLNEE